MILVFFTHKKLRGKTKLLFGALLLVGIVAVICEMIFVKVWSRNPSVISQTDGSSRRRTMLDERERIVHFKDKVREDYQADSVEDLAHWRSSFTPPVWKPKFKGRANLHAFDEWCGSSTADLFKNIHYPLFPHVRTTVRKLAVSPNRTNYGLRIFGYLHPYTDGEYVFALSSDDNSEFWLSTDDSPLNVQLLMWVGKTGAEWTAPGEFDKFASQTSTPIWLSAQRKYFFEVIHQQNDKGTDHVEVAWRLERDTKFQVIESQNISLYVDESALLPGDVAHIPLTAANHQHTPTKQQSAVADMLREDPRDTFYRVPLINSEFLQDVLPNCLYKPSYKIKGVRISRNQGLLYARYSYVYPNDYTRLTHVETEKSCFYPKSPKNNNRFSLSIYMTLDHPDDMEKGNKLPSMVTQETNNMLKNISDTKLHKYELQRRTARNNASQPQLKSQKLVKPLQSVPTQASKHHLYLQQNQTEGQVKKVDQIKTKQKLRTKKTQKPKSVVSAAKVKWSQTFQFRPLELHARQTDEFNSHCHISGNLLLQSRDALPVVKVFMDQLNKKHNGQFMLVRVINVVKRVDKIQGSRYLLELEVKDVSGQLLRLSHYIYSLSSQRSKEFTSQQLQPQLMLCNLVGFHWNPAATVHFVIAVKNQARWVQRMERLFRETQDTNFNLIITDYSSTDMNVMKALQKSSIPKYQYAKLSGNFERSAGLQAGIDLVEDPHSIVFLCDLHIHLPSSIIDSIRKHCVEGYMAFTPIVLRLKCGSTPSEAAGLWANYGVGLLGIYKSDLKAVGGMNTKEFRDHLGGEDWDLLNRIMQAGLEVERICLRNFFHHFHSHHGMWNRRTQL